MKKRLLSLLMAVCVLTGLLSTGSLNVSAVVPRTTLVQLKAKFPHNKYWNHVGSSSNNQDGYTNTPCPNHSNTNTCNAFNVGGYNYSSQCMGFAEKLGYDATGYNPRNNAYGWYTYTSSSAVDHLKPGDIVRFTPSYQHSVYVIGVKIDINGNTSSVTVAEANYGGTSNDRCRINWGREISASTLKTGFIHVRSAPAITHSFNQGVCSCCNGKLGDVNGDGVVDSTDSTILSRYLAKWVSCYIDPLLSDMNQDGVINSADGVLLKRYLAGWDIW